MEFEVELHLLPQSTRKLQANSDGGAAMLKRSLTMLCVLLAPLAACAPQHAYQPSEHANATIKGPGAADYQIPKQAPQGDVRLASFGFSRVTPPNQPANEPERVLHLRMIVANNSGQPWHLDTRQQLLEVQGVGRFSPAFASSHEGVSGFPAIAVAPGGRRTIDLFYRLPTGMNHASVVGEFDEVWRVDLPGQAVVERTPFDRIRVNPSYAYGYGPYGYMNYGRDPVWYPAYPLYPGYQGSLDIGAPTWY